MIRIDPILVFAGLSGAAAVGLGAYGAHGLKGDDFVKHAWETAVTYQLVHALALVGVHLLRERREGWARRFLSGAAILFMFGTLGFAGSLYAFGLTGEIVVPGLAPLGGMSLMAGWVLLAFSAFRKA